MTTDLPFSGLALRGSLRPSQQLALRAFEADRAAGRTTTHLVAPPGSGKTVVGLEIVRRLGQPALVLAPTVTVARQWEEQLALFSDRPAEITAPGGPLRVLTYQSVCQTSDPGGALRAAARERLFGAQAAATGITPDKIRADTDALSGAARERSERELATEVARMKRAVARGERLGVELDQLVSPSARRRIAQLRESGVRTLVLDECHHLASLWGYLIRSVIETLGEPHIVALTATSPSELTGPEAELYTDLLGPIDYEIPAPAVVRDGHLAPYQELAWFTTPLDSELDWLKDRHARFAEMLDRLHDPPQPGEEDLAFSPWVIGRIRYRDTGDERAQVPFATLAAARPELARAGLRYLSHAGLELPDDAPRGEGWREPPALEDWLVLIGDYALGCLRSDAGEAAKRRFEELRVGLRDLGFTLTRQGVRRGGSEVDNVLTRSAAKPLGAVEVLAHESEARGGELRAVVLCDSEKGERQPDDSPLALSGGARGVMSTLAGDIRTAALRPLLVTGQTIGCLPGDADRFMRALGATGSELSEGMAVLQRPGWENRDWVEAAGDSLAQGTTQLLVSTRGLLGEGWDAPRLNVLIDLTTVAADVSVRQMRGRTLRLDPSDPVKLASNWDVVCVAPDLARGAADYGRFVRRHDHLRAPCDDGSIESGVSHVHALLTPYEPPAADQFLDLNRDTVSRASDREAARVRWRIGEPYVSEDVSVLLVRRARTTERSEPGPGRRRLDAAGEDRTQTTGGFGLLAPEPGPVPKPNGPLAGFRVGRLRSAYPPVLALDRAARAVVDAYVAVGEIRAEAGATLALTPRAGGAVRCSLTGGDARENQLLSSALEEAISPAQGQRYVVSRPVWPDGLTSSRAIWRALTGRPALAVAWNPVPSDFARHKDRATAFHAAWQANVGPAELDFAGREGAPGRAELAASAASGMDYVTSRRLLWH